MSPPLPFGPNKLPPVVEIRTSPHLHHAPSVETIMRNVVYALLPIAAFSVWQYGISALLLIITVVVSCRGTERLFARLSQRPVPTDLSGTITALLLALTLPPGFPLWMGVVAAFVAIGMGKSLFGGLGFNVVNPALLGRAFVQAAFPVAITTWTPPLAPGRFMELIPSTLTLPLMSPPDVTAWSRGLVDSFSGATPLAQWKFDGVMVHTSDLFTGMVAGSAGESSALLILLCAGYLMVRRMMDWRLPLYVLSGAFLAALPFYLIDPVSYPDPLFMLFSGGLMLGAMFMASDMVGTPVTPLGVAIFGLFVGVVTIMIRLFGGLPEGVMYAILLGNVLVPLIERVSQPRVYGTGRGQGKGGLS